MSLVLWDTAGQEDYDNLRSICYNKAHAIIICFSVDSRTTFDNVLLKWLPEVIHYCSDLPRILVGTKTDLRPAATGEDNDGYGEFVTNLQGSRLSRDINALAYCECSAKTGDNIQTVFQTTARAVLVNQNSSNVKRQNCQIL